MIVIRVEMWPHGDESRKSELGIAYVANDGTGTSQVGNYDVQLMKSASMGARRSGVWKTGRVEGFPRLRLGQWDLIFRALLATVGYRNRRGLR